MEPELPAPHVNAQILDAVRATRTYVIQDAVDIGKGMVYQQVAQSLGLSIQDAVTHLGQMLMLDAAITAKVAELMLVNEMELEQGRKILGFFQDAVTFSHQTLADVGETAKAVLEDFKTIAGEQ
jgi:hypothetical protein